MRPCIFIIGTRAQMVKVAPVLREAASIGLRHTEVIDADLSGSFDSISHVGLLKSVARRVPDRQMLLDEGVADVTRRGRRRKRG